MAKGFTPKENFLENNSNPPEEPKYNVLEETTMGFSVVDENLTKDQAKKVINELTNDGVNPARIKIERVL